MLNSERLQEIKEEFEKLLYEAKNIVRLNCSKHEYDRAKAYWINPIECALEKQSMGQGSMEETIEILAMKEEEKEDFENLTDEDLIELLEEIAFDIGGRVIYNYSGRGMFDRKCVGIVCSDVTRCIEEASQKGFTGASTDSMGLDSIVYWPKINVVSPQ